MKRLITLLALVCGSAQAQFYTGNELWTKLTSTSDTYVDQSIALGFIGGVADSFNGMLFCIPGRVTVGQARDITIQHLSANPQTRHKSAYVLVSQALMAAWPCKKS